MVRTFRQSSYRHILRELPALCGPFITPQGVATSALSAIVRHAMPKGVYRRASLLERWLGWAGKAVDGQCWIWRGPLFGNGYGRIYVGKRGLLAHRVGYEIFKGPVLPGMFVCHTCDVKACVNPSHLYMGSRADNARDAKERGLLPVGVRNGAYTHPESRPRGDLNGSRLHPELLARGERNGGAKLSRRDVIAIVHGHLNGRSNVQLGKDYGVSDVSIGNIIRGKTWTIINRDAAGFDLPTREKP